MADSNGGLQLLPETRRKIDVYIPGQNRWLALGLGWVILVVLVWGGLWFYRHAVEGKIADADRALKQIDDSRQPADEAKLLQLKAAITAAKPVLAGHVVWSTALARVQGLVLPAVQFDNLSAKLDKQEYNFKAFASSFVTVAKQIAAFYSDDAITNLEIGRLTARPDGKVEFTAKLTLDLNKINHPAPAKK